MLLPRGGRIAGRAKSQDNRCGSGATQAPWRLAGSSPQWEESIPTQVTTNLSKEKVEKHKLRPVQLEQNPNFPPRTFLRAYAYDHTPRPTPACAYAFART